MPQMQLPFFPEGVTHINAELAVQKRDGGVTYFNGHMPIFMHGEDDVCSFRMITAQFCVNGNVKQMDIVRAFGVTPISVKRAVARYREQGPKGFYAEPRRRGAGVLTAPVLAQAQRLFDQGLERGDVAKALDIKSNTLGKAVRAGRVHDPGKKRSLRATRRSREEVPRASGAARTVRRRWAWGPPMSWRESRRAWGNWMR